MAKALITWLGEDHLHGTDGNGDPRQGPRSTTWNGIKFPIGEPIEITNEKMIATARTNPFFEVIEDRGPLVQKGKRGDGNEEQN
jgi:hypothetical protein